MASATGDPGAYGLAFDEGKAALANQASTLKEVRDRAGTVVSSAAVVAALVAGLSFSDARVDRLGAWSVIGGAAALGGFILLVISAVMIWRPMEGRFALDAGVLVGSYIDGTPPTGLPEMHRELALHLGRHATHNGRQISDRLDWFTTGLWAFLVEVLGLAVILVDVAIK